MRVHFRQSELTDNDVIRVRISKITVQNRPKLKDRVQEQFGQLLNHKNKLITAIKYKHERNVFIITEIRRENP